MSLGDHIHIAKPPRGRGPRTKRARARIRARADAEAKVQRLADFERQSNRGQPHRPGPANDAA